MSEGTMSAAADDDRGVHVVRAIEADAETVWEAFTTAEGLAAWWWPMFDDTRYEVDAQPDGIFRIASSEGGIGVSGRYLDLDEPNRIEHTWIWHGGYDAEREEQLVVIELEERDALTLVTVRQSCPDDEVDPLTEGWEDCLTRLEELHATD